MYIWEYTDVYCNLLGLLISLQGDVAKLSSYDWTAARGGALYGNTAVTSQMFFFFKSRVRW